MFGVFILLHIVIHFQIALTALHKSVRSKMAAAMDVDASEDYGEGPSASCEKGKKRFEVKKVRNT